MKRTIKFFLTTVLLLTGFIAISQDKNFYIFLCFGQSNMEGNAGIQPVDTMNINNRFQVMEAVDCPGLGRIKGHWYPAVPPLCRCHTGLNPADYFGRTMVAHLPQKIRVGIINVSVAGCKIELFVNDSLQSYVSKAPSWMAGIIKEYNGDPYGQLVAMARLAQKDGVIKGILLHQGESNPNDSLWTEKVKMIYDNLMKDLKLKPRKVPLLAGETVNADQDGVCAGMNKIIAMLPKKIKNAYVISSSGCTAAKDKLHFNAEGYREFGKRYAIKMLALLGYNNAE